MTSVHRSLVACALAGCAAALNPATAAAQADSGRADTALARYVGWTSRTTLPGWVLRSILTDDPAHVLGLVPGVVLRRAETGLAAASAVSIRGGAPGEASVYVDGAPVRFITLGTPGITLGPGSVAEVAVTTGPPDLGLPDLRDGVIEYVTRSGGHTLAGSLRAATDQAFTGAGFRRFEGSLGGPFVGVDHATWLVGGTLMEQRSHYAGRGTGDVASFVPGGVDTLVAGDTVLRFSDRRAYDWGTELRGHAKLQFAYGGGGTLSVTGVSNEVQERFFPGTFALAPTLYTGSRSLARLVVVNWRHSFRLLGTPLTLLVNASHGTNQVASGLLEPGSEIVSRTPGFGLTLDPLRFSGADSIPSPLNGQIIRNIRSGGGSRVPFLNHPGLGNVQTSRANPFAMAAGWPQQGFDGPLSLITESRSEGRWAIAWDPAHAHRLSVGGDLRAGELGSYTVRSLLSLSGLDAYRAAPQRVGVYMLDRFGRSALRGEIGLRYDLYGRVGRFADTPGRIYSHPEYNRAGALVEDTAYTGSVRRVMTVGRTHHGVSLRAAVERDVAFRTTLRATYGRWLEPPPVRLVMQNANADLDFTNSQAMFGRDVDYGYASLAEVGVRHRFAPELMADAAIYRRSRASYGAGIRPFADPATPGDFVNVNVLTKLSDVVDLGLDLAVDWRPVAWLTTRAVYSLRHTDPSDRITLPFGSTLELPPFATHSFTMAAVARPPAGVLANFEGSMLLRLVSGTWYSTGLSPGIITGAITPPFDAVGTTDNHQLPWTKRLDARIKKTFTVSTLELAFVAEARNLLAWQNVLALFSETGSTANDAFRDGIVSAEMGSLDTEATGNGALAGDGTVTLPGDCSSWIGPGTSGPVNCVALKRVEARFGNGDGLYTLPERLATLHGFYAASYGPQRFYGAGRTVRLGIEIHW